MVTPANQADCNALIPLLLSMEEHNILHVINSFYGDNAYNTLENKKWLKYFGKECKFHTKLETGKLPKNRRSAKRKSRIRSKIESTFGILKLNYHFGRSRVVGMRNIYIENSIIMIAWNHFILISYLIDKFENHISIRKLFYEN